MTAKWLGQGLEIVAGALIALVLTHQPADAARAKSSHVSRASVSSHHGRVGGRSGRVWRPSFQRSALQCVPFARENSGIEISGNAGTWWNSADGLYERGAHPEVGSILNFRATGRMRLGHVAVVTNVITPRHIEIDHANWGAPGRISRNIDVVDVSASNDWTEVRVALSQAEDYGSVYPTFGFIYDRPDRGIMVANTTPQPMPTLRPASELRLASERINMPSGPQAEEVAEAIDGDDVSPAPRYSSRHRARQNSRVSKQHASAPIASRGKAAAASTLRVSTRSGPALKAASHKPAKRRF